MHIGVMPDHFHALLTGLDSACNLLSFSEKLQTNYWARIFEEIWQHFVAKEILRPNSKAAGQRRSDCRIYLDESRPKGLCEDPRESTLLGFVYLDWKKNVSFVQSWVPDWKAKAPA